VTTNEVYYRDLPAIPEADWVSLPSMMSQTFLSHFANCPRSAYLLRKYKGGAPSAAMIRGSLFHETVEELTALMLANEEETVPPELARDVLAGVLDGHPEWVIPPHEVDAVRLMVYHWADNTAIDPETVFGVEQMWHHELPDGTVIRGKVDLLLMQPGMSRNRDYKTSLAMKSQQDWEADFQSIFYDVLLAYGETEDGVRLGPEIEMFESSVIYPRYVFDDGLGQRTSYRDRMDLRDHYGYMGDLVKKAKEAFATGKFPAIPGDHCDRCPAKAECPIPAQLRDGKGEIETIEEARIAAEDRDFHGSASRRLSKSLRAWVDEHGPLEYGANREIAIDASESQSVNWDTLPDAINRAVELGEPFVPEQHVKHKIGTRLTSRKREAVGTDE
jgi:hypothetical protein